MGKEVFVRGDGSLLPIGFRVRCPGQIDDDAAQEIVAVPLRVLTDS